MPLSSPWKLPLLLLVATNPTTHLRHLQTAGIPKDKIGGFRAPFLIFDSEQREVLQKNGE